MAVGLKEKGITFYDVKDFNLEQTLTCGQCFRWKPNADGSFTGVIGTEVITAVQIGNAVMFYGAKAENAREMLSEYFDLERDYGAIKKILSQNDVFREAITYAPGIHILKQDPWETVCSFIISQNNNIKRIMGIIDRLCESYGQHIEGEHYCFPTAQTLSWLTVENLQPLKCGFRAKYILDAARRVANGQLILNELYDDTLDIAREKLMKVYGIGNKVADCSLLFGFNRLECFPQDVWIKRAVAALFPQGLPEYVLPYAGIAQQYLFHYVRMQPQVLEDSANPPKTK